MTAAAVSPAAVALDGIAKKFGEFVALRSVSLSVAPGEFVCFLGPSGCGKTTLLRIIAGLEHQNLGQHLRLRARLCLILRRQHRDHAIHFRRRVSLAVGCHDDGVRLDLDRCRRRGRRCSHCRCPGRGLNRCRRLLRA